MKEATVLFFETEWTPEEIEAGGVDPEKHDQSPMVREFSVMELARFLRGWEPSQGHLHKRSDLSRVWFSRSEDDYITGGKIEESMHLRHEATPREQRIWAWAIRAALKRGLIR